MSAIRGGDACDGASGSEEPTAGVALFREQACGEAAADAFLRGFVLAGAAANHGVDDAEWPQPTPRGGARHQAAAIKHEMPILTLAADGLPTATVTVGGRECELTIDTGARYAIVGKRLKSLGEGLNGLPPVKLVQGLQRRPLAVEEVFRFRCRTVYGQTIVVDALAVEGCVDEFIAGLDFLRANKAVINRATYELTYGDRDEVTLPFVCRDEETGLSRPGVVRIVTRLRVECERRVNVRVHVQDKGGDVGLFTPACSKFKQLLVVPMLATMRDGCVSVPIMNVQGGRLKVSAQTPARHVGAPRRDDDCDRSHRRAGSGRDHEVGRCDTRPSDAGVAGRGGTRHQAAHRRGPRAHAAFTAMLSATPEEARWLLAAGNDRHSTRHQDRLSATDLPPSAPTFGAGEQHH